MKKPYRQSDGLYHVDGKTYETLFGSREQVHNGTVYKTTGGLTKKDILMNKWGRLVSANKFKSAKKEMRLQKYGFFAKKGKFGAVTRKNMDGGKPSSKMNQEKLAKRTVKKEKKEEYNYLKSIKLPSSPPTPPVGIPPQVEVPLTH